MHRAVLKSGEDVVVKVQYPGVDETVEQDLRNIKALLQVVHPASAATSCGRTSTRREVYQELEERLHEELDYVNEAKNIALFQKMFRDDPRGADPGRSIPTSRSRRVLTMSRLEGYPLRRRPQARRRPVD